jgi:hypothetical protein
LRPVSISYKHAAERPDVGTFIDDLTSRLLGTHVRRGAENHAFIRPIDRDGERVFQVGGRPLAPRFRQPEIEHLHDTVGRDGDVGGLQIAMDDSFVVSRFQRIGDLARDCQRFRYLQPTRAQTVRQRLALDELEDEPVTLVTMLDSVDSGYVRMIESREHTRLPVEPRAALGIGHEDIGQNLDRHIAAEGDVARPVDISRPAACDQGPNLVRSEPMADE